MSEADKGPLAVRLEKREDRSRRIRVMNDEWNQRKKKISVCAAIVCYV